MAYSYVDYTGDGATRAFAVPFPYLSPETVHVFVQNTEKAAGSDYLLDRSVGTILFAEPPDIADSIRIRRITPTTTDKLIVTFRNGAQLDEATMNLSQFQLLYILQEFVDRIVTGTGGDGVVENGGGYADIPPAVSGELTAIREALDQFEQELDALVQAVLAEHAERVADLEAKLDELLSGLGTLGTRLVDLVNTELSDNLASTTTISGIISRLGAAESAIATETTARATADTAMASRLTVVEADLNTPTTGLKARLTSEETARSTADSAVAQRVSTLESTINNPDTGLEKAHTRIANVEQSIIDGVGGDVTAIALRVSTLESSVNNPTNGLSATAARLTTEEGTRADAVSAVALRATNLEAAVGHTTTGLAAAHTKVADEALARANADGTLSGRVTTVEGAISDPNTGLPKAHARITDEETARTSAVSAMAQRVTTLEGSVGDPNTGLAKAHSRIDTEATTRASADTANATAITTLQSTVNNSTTGLAAAHSRIETEATTRASADTANAASISSLQTTITDPNTGLAKAHVKITDEATARASADGNLSGKRTIAVDVNGRVTGMNITSTSGPGSNTSLISFLADVFKVFNGSGDEAVFEVAGGAVRVKCLVAGKVSTFAYRFNPDNANKTMPNIAYGSADVGNIAFGSIPTHPSWYWATSDACILKGWTTGADGYDKARFGNSTQHFTVNVVGNGSGGSTYLIYGVGFRTRTNGGSWSSWTSIGHDFYVTPSGGGNLNAFATADLTGLTGASEVQFGLRVAKPSGATGCQVDGCWLYANAYN